MENKQSVGIAAVLLLFVIAVLLFFQMTSKPQTNTTSDAPLDLNFGGQSPQTSSTPPQITTLQIEDERPGTGSAIKQGDNITVNYKGALLNGQQFDSSYDRHQPLDIQIGVGKVIQGWDEGLLGMKVGGKRKLVIPPSLGYGNQVAGSIPPNSVLVFEIELLGILQPASPSASPTE